MKTFELYIKNHGDNGRADYEDTCQAEDIQHASEMFYCQLPAAAKMDWSAEDLEKYIQQADEPEYHPEEREERLYQEALQNGK